MTTLPVAPPAALWITRTLEDAGFETWTVGGAIRDALLQRPSDDWDFATRAEPKQVRRAFRRTVPIGMEHGTVGVLARDGTMYEVTTFRRDVETDGRHAVVSYADTVEEDLARRDFTINAIAWHPLREQLLDPFGGVEDLQRRVLRTVGSPAERFSEDYLRILRALRFAGQLSMSIEPATWTSLCAHVDRLTRLSAERVREELLKVLEGSTTASVALDLYARSGALEVLYPELDAFRSGSGSGPGSGPRPEAQDGARAPAGDGPRGAGAARSDPVSGGDAWRLTLATVDHLPARRPLLRLAALLGGIEAEAVAALLSRLRLSNQKVDHVAFIATAEALPGPDAADSAVRRWLSRTGVERLAPVARVQLAQAKAERDLGTGDRRRDVVRSWLCARAVRDSAPPLNVGDLALDGRGLIALGLKPGPHFGDILEGLLDWVLEDPTRNERGALEAQASALAGRLHDGDNDG